MKQNEFIKLRIAELQGRLTAANQLLMNKQMRVESKLIKGQIAALENQLERELVFVNPEPDNRDPVLIHQRADNERDNED